MSIWKSPLNFARSREWKYYFEDHRREQEEEKLGYDFEEYKKYMDNSRELEKQIQAGKQLWKE